MRALIASAVFAATACLALPAQAQTPENCRPLARAFALDLKPLPGGAHYGVPVSVNGTMKQFLLATGIPDSRLSRRAVEDLKLRPRQYGQMLTRNGQVIPAFGVTADLGVGRTTAPRQTMFVTEAASAFDGVFGRDLMQNYDVEMDFAGGKLNYFLTDHCPGRVVYWTSAGYTTVNFNGWDINSSRLDWTMPVLIDGLEVLAEIDTSLAQTTLDADTARSVFSLTPDSPGAVPMGGLDSNPLHRMFGYTFKTLKIGGLTIENPKMQVIPDIVGTKSRDTLRADSRVQRRTDNIMPTMQIGMDVLRRLHLYVAAVEQKLYITPASGQPVTLGQPAAN